MDVSLWIEKKVKWVNAWMEKRPLLTIKSFFGNILHCEWPLKSCLMTNGNVLFFFCNMYRISFFVFVCWFRWPHVLYHYLSQLKFNEWKRHILLILSDNNVHLKKMRFILQTAAFSQFVLVYELLNITFQFFDVFWNTHSSVKCIIILFG